MKVILTIPDAQLTRVTSAFAKQIPGKTAQQTDLDHLQASIVSYVQRIVQAYEEQAALALARKQVSDDIKLKVDVKTATQGV